MGCAFCGGGDRWIKTCLASDGSLFRVCDPCYTPRACKLVIVPGDAVVTARCNLCGGYGNPREFAEANPGGRKDAYSGRCTTCAKDQTR